MSKNSYLATSALRVEGESAIILRLTLIGQMEAWMPDGTNVLPLGRKTRALLAILALSAPRPVVRARLADLLWSRRHEEQARASLRQEIHRLLDALQPAGNDILVVTRDHVALRPDRVWLDVEEVLRATATEPAGLELLKGRLLDEFDGVDPAFDIWVGAERERLQDRARAVSEGLLRQQVEPEALIPIAQRLLAIDRSHEGAWRALMTAYAAQGDRGMAVQAYERCRTVLKEKLDSAPSPETQRLLAGIRAGGAAGEHDEAAGLDSDMSAPPHTGLRIGVLPLQLLGLGIAEEHLALSLANDITAAMSAFRLANLVSSSSLLQNGTRDELLLRRSLRLDFLVDGSVQRAGSRLRITTRLLDLNDGNRVAWVHRSDQDPTNISKLQDELPAEIAGQVFAEIMRIEFRRVAAMPLATATAYELVTRAIPLMVRLRRDDFDGAGDLMQRALAAEPDLADGHAWRAYWLALLAAQGWATDLEATRAEAGEHVLRAITLDCENANTLAIAGHVRASLHRQPREAMELHERSLVLNPNLPLAVGLSAVTLLYTGELDQAASRLARFARLSPMGPLTFFNDSALSLLALLGRDHAGAIRHGRRSSELSPNLTSGLKHYISALGHAGLQAESRIVLRRLFAVEPSFDLQHFLVLCPFSRSADVSHYANGLRLAGVPEGRAAVA